MPLFAPRRVPILLPCLIGLSIVAVAGEAGACLDLGSACEDAVGWVHVEMLGTDGIALDGMLLFEVVGANAPEPSPAALEMAVTLDGMPVAGAFETVDLHGVIGWRPAQALEPERQYLATGSVHNTQPDETCINAEVPFEFEFSTGSGPMPALVLPAVEVQEQLVAVSKQTLGNFVCCDGGFAFQEGPLCGGGGGGNGEIAHNEGFCTSIESTGTLVVALDVIVPGDGSAAAMLATRLVVDGVPEAEELIFGSSRTLRSTRSAAFCTEVVVRNLTTGAAVTTPKQCHGAGVEAQLGPQMLTPDSPVLAANCKGEPYTCTTSQFELAWDPMQCVPWPDGGTTGGGPTTSDTGSTDTSAGTSSAGTSSAGTSSDGTSSAGSGPGGDGLISPGCACASGPTLALGGPRELLLGLLVLGLRRPRRRA